MTYHTKAGSETRLAEVLVEGWKTMRRLKLVTSDPHSLVRDGSIFVEVFTWKDASIPDNAPAEVLALWKQMSGLTEPKGIDIKIVERVPTP